MCLNPGVAVLAVFLNGTISVNEASYEPRCYDHVSFFKTLKWTHAQWWKAKTKRQFLAAQSVHVRTTSEIKIDTAHINAMKAAGLGAPVVSCVKRKKWGLESVGWRWHWKRICK